MAVSLDPTTKEPAKHGSTLIRTPLIIGPCMLHAIAQWYTTLSQASDTDVVHVVHRITSFVRAIYSWSRRCQGNHYHGDSNYDVLVQLSVVRMHTDTQRERERDTINDRLTLPLPSSEAAKHLPGIHNTLPVVDYTARDHSVPGTQSIAINIRPILCI